MVLLLGRRLLDFLPEQRLRSMSRRSRERGFRLLQYSIEHLLELLQSILSVHIARADPYTSDDGLLNPGRIFFSDQSNS